MYLLKLFSVVCPVILIISLILNLPVFIKFVAPLLLAVCEEIPAVYLSMNEIARIYYYPNLTKKQQRIRDLFVVGCYTALRYSDLSTLTKENFSNGYITKITKKTGIRVVVPVHDIVQEIYERYEGNLMFDICSQHFNRYIKVICRKIGIDDKVNQIYTKFQRTPNILLIICPSR